MRILSSWLCGILKVLPVEGWKSKDWSYSYITDLVNFFIVIQKPNRLCVYCYWSAWMSGMASIVKFEPFSNTYFFVFAFHASPYLRRAILRPSHSGEKTSVLASLLPGGVFIGIGFKIREEPTLLIWFLPHKAKW